MTPTLASFVARLQQLQGASLAMTLAHGPPATATIPARHQDVGDITVYDDGDELTIEIGHKHHTHISSYNYDSFPEAERLGKVALDAAAFVDDIIHDRVCITVDFKGEQCIGSSHYYLDDNETSSSIVRGIGGGTMPGESRSERFLWSGPID